MGTGLWATFIMIMPCGDRKILVKMFGVKPRVSGHLERVKCSSVKGEEMQKRVDAFSESIYIFPFPTISTSSFLVRLSVTALIIYGVLKAKQHLVIHYFE